MFEPINPERSSTYEKIMSSIKASIFKGELKPGEKLPPERELAVMMGVSRTSLREALKLLAAMGLVTIKHGQGVFITEQDPDAYLKRFAESILLQRDTVADLFQIRKVLECKAAAWAAQKATGEQVKQLIDQVDKAQKMIQSKENVRLAFLAEHDAKFHNAVAEATQNQVLVRVMEHLLDLLTDSRAHSLAIPGRALQSVQEHAHVAKCIAGKDLEGAEKAMLNHLLSVEEALLKTIVN
ncbi:hypothetical protein SY88_12285 [Clostridiales bacterium PH28_bin88]|nr:hypothetical protein SY88_12285 [Clostridiales bacterium PH28_bin88]